MLPGQKELDDAEEKMSSLGELDEKTKNAIKDIDLFYEEQKRNRINTESKDMKQLLLLEFAGLFNGPEGRIKQALKDDQVVQSAINILSNDNSYQMAFKNSQIETNN